MKTLHSILDPDTVYKSRTKNEKYLSGHYTTYFQGVQGRAF